MGYQILHGYYGLGFNHNADSIVSKTFFVTVVYDLFENVVENSCEDYIDIDKHEDIHHHGARGHESHAP